MGRARIISRRSEIANLSSCRLRRLARTNIDPVLYIKAKSQNEHPSIQHQNAAVAWNGIIGHRVSDYKAEPKNDLASGSLCRIKNDSAFKAFLLIPTKCMDYT